MSPKDLFDIHLYLFTEFITLLGMFILGFWISLKLKKVGKTVILSLTAILAVSGVIALRRILVPSQEKLSGFQNLELNAFLLLLAITTFYAMLICGRRLVFMEEKNSLVNTGHPQA